MAYEAYKDKEIRAWEIPVADDAKALVGLRKYDNGPVKFAWGFQRLKKPDGSEVITRFNRWSFEATRALLELLPEILEEWDKLLAKPQSKGGR